MEPKKDAADAEKGFLDELGKEYLPYLTDIRKKLVILFVTFVVFALLGAIYYEQIIIFSLRIFRIEGVNFAFTSQFQFINLALSSALVVGIIATLPLLIYEILSFLGPGLNKKEYRFLITLIPLAFLLFTGGFAYGVAVMKYVINLFYANTLKLDVTNLLDISVFLTQIIITSSLLGVMFEFPLVITALIKMRVVTLEAVVARRPFIYFGLMLVAAVLPPTDLLSLALLTLPLFLIFETTVLFNRYFIISKG
ncbi:MAG: TatCy [candidate division CPR1 bacterium GW2011_GWC1_49_13]|uniref:TatCy n=1 Tax=candidate division CPR1 bacterium GW2011_GWC1_49_13 TaxID=1618342 RepID=A0A0G1YHZ3_9BACT|nr:MAG: TatCy [candidate division CPR1 bacterium GW2011_GWC1_49_13]